MSGIVKNSDKKELKKVAPKSKYTLKSRTFVDGKWLEKGAKVELTKEGKEAFKFKHRI